MRYLTPDEIRENKNLFLEAYAQEGNYDLHEEGFSARLVRKYSFPQANLLDCGAGSGFFLRLLSSDGYQNLYGADIDDYRKFADEKSGLVKSFAVLDLCSEHLPWKNGFFDVITAWEVFEHLENPCFTARELERVLKPGGHLILSMPNVLHLVSRLIFLKNGELPRWSEENNHLGVFTPSIFKKIFRNFKITEMGYFKGGFPYRVLAGLSFLPANRWFGKTAYWVLEKNT